MSIINRVLENREEYINNEILKELNKSFQEIKGLEGSNIFKNIVNIKIRRTLLNLYLYDEYDLYIEYKKIVGKNKMKKIGKITELPINDEVNGNLYYIDIVSFNIELYRSKVRDIVLSKIDEGKIGFIIDLSDFILYYSSINSSSVFIEI